MVELGKPIHTIMNSSNAVIAASDVAALARSSSRAARVFALLGVEGAFEDKRTVLEAASAVGIEPAELIALIDHPSPPSRPVTKVRVDAPLPQITEYIVEHHHRRTRTLLIDILDRFEGAIPGDAELSELKLLIERLAHDLVPHMAREERYLFPYIDMIDRPVLPEHVVMVPVTGSIEHPLQSIRHDHTNDVALLAEIRECAARIGSAMPAEPVAGLLARVRELDRDLQEHIDLENNVLFPRALEAELSLMNKRHNR